MAAGTTTDLPFRRTFIASFATAADVLAAALAARQKELVIRDIYTPYPVHGLDQAMGVGPTRLPWACFAFGLLGVVVALWFQFWSMTQDWLMNVGGKPLNSLPAYVPVTFEMMVLLAGVGVFVAFLLSCRLFPGKRATVLPPGVTKDQFVMVLEAAPVDGDAEAVRQICHEFHATFAEEREQ
jgi:hypothetical protein